MPNANHALKRIPENFRVLLIHSGQERFAALQDELSSMGLISKEAHSAAQARTLMEAAPSAAVLIATKLTDMDGLSLARWLIADYPELQIMLVRESEEELDFNQLQEAGITDYITLPMAERELQFKLAGLLRQWRLIREQKSSEREALRNQQIRDILSRLLRLAVADNDIEEILTLFLEHITSIPWLGLSPKGAAFLTSDQDQSLILTAHKDLATPLISTCARVDFGRCLCGRAAFTKEVVFASCIDDRHDNLFDGIEPHGHYCVPILSSTEELLGIFTLYTEAGVERNSEIEEILVAAASTMAGIIKHRQAAQLLQESQERHRAITSAALDAIVMIDHHSTISFWNPAAETIFGYRATEALGRGLHELIDREQYQEQFIPILEEFFRTGRDHTLGNTMEVTAVHRDNHAFPVEISLAGLKVKENWQAVGIIRDITNRKREEEAKEDLQLQLKQSQKLEAIGTLAAGIAHDFNNILSAILGFSSIAKEEAPPGSQLHSDLASIQSAGNRAKELVHQILAFSRQTDQEKVPVEVQLIVKETMKLLRNSIPSNIIFQQAIDKNCGCILAEPSQVQQILMNLCTNGYHAMKDKGGILGIEVNRVDLKDDQAEAIGGLEAGPYIRLGVRDSGEGIEPAALERIFEPFYTTKPQGEGTGMGLSVVHGIVHSLGGSIRVESSSGSGTLFEVYLPRQEKPEDLPLASTGETADQGRGHILLVDDEEPILEIMARSLTKRGYTVTTRIHSIEALEAFRARPERFDLVITDHAMPNMVGTDLAREMLELRPDIPIILSTGFLNTLAPGYVEEIGIKAVVMKPAPMNEVLKIVKEYLPGDEEYSSGSKAKE